MTELALLEELSPKVRDYLQTAKDSAEVLLRLLNDILDFSKMDAGGFALESSPFSLRAVLDETMRSFAAKAREKGLALACDLPGAVPDVLMGDAVRLRQILTNLVGNALKFTEQGEVVVRVSIAASASEEVCLKLAVCDTGIGISPEDQGRIFAPFAQADSFDHTDLRRHRVGAGHRFRVGLDDGRPPLVGEPTRPRQLVLLHRPLPATARSASTRLPAGGPLGDATGQIPAPAADLVGGRHAG